ncbi:MAG TPA: hypothetical protein VHU88_12710 [Sporichthyaceae bacterium]|jgi:hypothetical protein|nr:hypothetical protein [Sporichthyaceae bacterium]
MNLSATGTVVLVVIIAIAMIAMLAVIARANNRAAATHSEPHRAERADARYPGLDADAVENVARAAGDDVGATVEPGGHVVRGQQH